MKFILLSALFALAIATVSASSTSGVVYIYLNNLDHPKSTFLKLDGNKVLTDGAACKGNKTLPGKGGALTATFTTVNNQWDFNGQHDNEISMGYIKIKGNKCLSLTKGNPLSAKACPSFSEEIKAGNQFAWFHDKRNSAIWAYGGDKDAVEHNGVIFDTANFQTNGKTLSGVGLHDDPIENTFMGINHISLGHSAHGPRGCA